MWGNAALRDRLTRIELRVDELSTRCAQLAEKIDRSSTAKMAAELDDLRAAFDLHSKGLRRELGRLWKRVPAEAAAEDTPPETADDTRARLRSQLPIPRIGAEK